MKKITLLFFTVLYIAQLNAQSTYIVEAPLNNNTPNTNRAPNGSAGHVYMRACYLVLQSELANIPSGTSLTTFGFTLFAGAAGSSATGNFTVYLENTSDITYLKGTTYATAIAPMTSVYANVMTLPVTPNTTSVTVTLSTPFTYTGGGIYVAFDWYNPGPYATTGANFLGENAALPLPAGGGANALSGTGPPTSLNLTASRPSFLFGFNNTYTNEAYVIGVEAPGKVAAMFNTPHVIKALVQNTGTVTLTNKQVSVNVSGANTFANTLTISTLAPGSTTLVSFAAFNPTTAGMNTITVAVPADNNNANNQIIFKQQVTCNEWAQNPPVGNYTVNSVGYGTGSGIIGTPFTSPVNTSLSGIRGAISMNSGNVGQQMYALLVSSAGAIIGTTSPIVLTGTMLGTFQTFTFSSPPALSANTLYYLCLAQTTGTTSWSPFGTFSSYYVPQNLIYYSALSAGFMSLLAPNYGYFGIEGVFVPDIVHPVSTPTAVCTGSSAILTAQGIADSFTWSPGGANSSSISVTPTANAVYSVTGSYSGQCTSTGSVTVFVVQLPNVTAAVSPTAVCLGGTVTLTAGGASTYTWDTNATTQTIVESPGATTIYTVTGTSALGCVNSNTVSVTVNSFTPSITSPTTVCTGSQVTLVAGGGVSYLWVNNSAPFGSITITLSANTTFTVNSTDANGCKGSATVPVFVNPNPTVTAAATRSVMCRKEVNTITAQGATSFSWSTGAANAVISVTPTLALPLIYTVTGTDNNGCKSATTVTVQVNTCTGIGESFATRVSVFPNPGSGLYSIVNEDGLFSRIEIYSHLGQLVKSRVAPTGIDEIDITGEANGLYEVYLFGEHRSARLRIVKE